MKNRKGFALLAAIWLCVAIAAVALQFSLEARQRRLLGINTSERGRGRAAAMGALNATQASLDASLRQGPGTAGAAAGLRVALIRGWTSTRCTPARCTSTAFQSMSRRATSGRS
jgi:hypothetical protein